MRDGITQTLKFTFDFRCFNRYFLNKKLEVDPIFWTGVLGVIFLTINLPLAA